MTQHILGVITFNYLSIGAVLSRKTDKPHRNYILMESFKKQNFNERLAVRLVIAILSSFYLGQVDTSMTQICGIFPSSFSKWLFQDFKYNFILQNLVSIKLNHNNQDTRNKIIFKLSNHILNFSTKQAEERKYIFRIKVM